MIGILPVIILQLVLMNVTEDTVVSTRLKNVSTQFAVLASYIDQNTSENNVLTDRGLAEMADNVVGLSVSGIQIIDRDLNIITDTYRINTGKICVSQDVNQCFNGRNFSYSDKKNECIVLVHSIKNNETGNLDYVMFATSSISDIYSAMSSVRLMAISIVVIIAVIVTFLAFFFSNYLVRPFSRINDVIKRVEKGNLSSDISLEG